MGELSGKVAIVTGATQGIGRGIALRFAKEGAQLLVCSRTPQKGAELLAELAPLTAAHYVAADIGVKEDVNAVVDAALRLYGRVDILVNNAQTVPPWTALEHKPDAEFGTAFATGFYASLWAMQAVFPAMRAQGGGRIINFGSIFSVIGARYSADYNGAKEAIRALTRTAANEWGRYNILVNTILPIAESEGTRLHKAKDPAGFAKARARVPLQWHGDPERDIGGVCVGLACDEGCFITGETFFVDGGASVTRPLQTWQPGVRYETKKA
jgi:NAD(P)-dependent dehydrogenase (short-subunit alcohol dehydrogenase family)